MYRRIAGILSAALVLALLAGCDRLKTPNETPRHPIHSTPGPDTVGTTTKLGPQCANLGAERQRSKEVLCANRSFKFWMDQEGKLQVEAGGESLLKFSGEVATNGKTATVTLGRPAGGITIVGVGSSPDGIDPTANATTLTVGPSGVWVFVYEEAPASPKA